MRIKKMNGFINKADIEFIIEDIRGDKHRLPITLECNIDLSLVDLSSYDMFVVKDLFDTKLDSFILSNNFFYRQSFELMFNDLVHSLFLENKERVKEYLRDISCIDENEEISDIYDVCIRSVSNMKIIEGEILTVLYADIDVEGSATRQKFEEFEYECCDADFYGCEGFCDCKHNYFDFGIDKKLIGEKNIKLLESCLANTDISDININDKKSLVKKLKQAYIDDVINTYNTRHKSSNGMCYSHETTVDLLNFTLNSIRIERTILSCNSDVFSIDFKDKEAKE